MNSLNDEFQIPTLDGMSVLLVEDAPDNQFLIGSVLERLGARVHLAENGIEGSHWRRVARTTSRSHSTSNS